jgi:hypothetical protein
MCGCVCVHIRKCVMHANVCMHARTLVRLCEHVQICMGVCIIHVHVQAYGRRMIHKQIPEHGVNCLGLSGANHGMHDRFHASAWNGFGLLFVCFGVTEYVSREV